MKTAREYASEYREIASNLGMRGDGTEMLIQMLAHFTYTNEVENIAYANEASLERALLEDSKIQHCVEVMYSVFRGRNPRAILRFRPTKFFDLNVYDKLVDINSLSLYYLGYLSGDDEEQEGSSFGLYDASLGAAGGLKFTYAPTIIQPSDFGYVTILCMIANKSIETKGTLTSDNLYYIDVKEGGLSQDSWVKLSEVNTGSLEFVDVTREFQSHLLEERVFDLTLPDWGSRFYIPEEYRKENTKLNAMSFKYVKLEDLNSHDLSNIKFDGAEPVSIHDTEDDVDFITSLEEVSKGVVLIPELPRENMSSAHYKANKDRFMGSVLRSNDDVSELLKEMYPDKVKSTTFKFNSGINNREKMEVVTSPDLSEADLILKPTVTKYNGSDSSSNVSHVDFSVNLDTLKEISIPIVKTNEEKPFTTTYSVKSESPISTISQGNTVYVIKTYVDDDGDLVNKVIQVQDLEEENLILQYRFESSGLWTNLSEGQIPARPHKTEEIGNKGLSKTTSKTTSTTTEGPEDVIKEKTVTESESQTESSTASLSQETEEPDSVEPLEIRLIDKTVTSLKEVDHEYLPYVGPSTTYFGITDRNYVIPVSGNLKILCEFPIEIPTIMYSSGSSVQAESYEVISCSKELEVEITSSGVVRILGLTGKLDTLDKTFTAVFRATLDNVGYTTTLHINTTASKNSLARILELYCKHKNKISSISKGTVGSYQMIYDKIADFKVWSKDIVTIDAEYLKELLISRGLGTTGVVKLAIDCKSDVVLDSEQSIKEVTETVSSDIEKEKIIRSILKSETIKSTKKIYPTKQLEFTSAISKNVNRDKLVKRTFTKLDGIVSTYKLDNSLYIEVEEENENGGLISSYNVEKTFEVPEIIIGGIKITNLVDYVVPEEKIGSTQDGKSNLIIYYVPQNPSDLLSSEEINKFIKTRSSYYITNNIEITKGTLIVAEIDLRVYLYQNDSIEKRVLEILDKYKYNFGLDKPDKLRTEIESQLAKIPNIARINDLIITYKSESGDLLSEDQVEELLDQSYFEFSTYITSNLFSKI